MKKNYKALKGVNGIFLYHLGRRGGSSTEALCGAETLPSGEAFTIEEWQTKAAGHLWAKYCPECHRLAIQEDEPTNRSRSTSRVSSTREAASERKAT